MPAVAAKRNFGRGNLALIIALALVLTFFAFKQKANQVPIQASNNQANDILSPQFADNISGNSIDGGAATELALNSPNSDQTQADTTARVLGAATYNKDFVNQLNISVQNTSEDNQMAAQNYAQEISALFNGDKVAIGSPTQEAKFLNEIKELAVPASIGDYQKLMIGYYALNYVNDLGQADNSASQYISQIKAQLDLARSTFAQAYLINLP